jgi:hypothetical protein
MKLSFSTKALGALAGVAMVAATMTSPAAAFSLSSPSIDESYSAAPVEKVWWHHGGCWHCGGGWGWHRHWGPGWGGGRHCWMSPWGWRCRYW